MTKHVVIKKHRKNIFTINYWFIINICIINIIKCRPYDNLQKYYTFVQNLNENTNTLNFNIVKYLFQDKINDNTVRYIGMVYYYSYKIIHQSFGFWAERELLVIHFFV